MRWRPSRSEDAGGAVAEVSRDLRRKVETDETHQPFSLKFSDPIRWSNFRIQQGEVAGRSQLVVF